MGRTSQGVKTMPPTILVVFGVTGDLSHRYLLPALNQIAKVGKLPAEFSLVGVSRRQIKAGGLLQSSEKDLQKYLKTFTMNLSDLEDYQRLGDYLESVESKMSKKPQIIFYFAVPPPAVLPIVRLLGKAGLNKSHTKLLLEKPFGVDWASAYELISQTDRYFEEDQVYRIDHYLAKEMVQNIVVFLGSNALFRNVWDQRFISDIEINVAEAIGIEGRAGFYEPTGALRDIVQSHLLQLTALTLMEPCSSVFEFRELPMRRLAALKALAPAMAAPIIRGQYRGYRQEVKNPGSLTETFVSMTVASSDPRWKGVPIRLTTGKCLSEKLTEIRVRFKKSDESWANLLVLRVQPREGIDLDLWVKQPGFENKLQKLPLRFAYEHHFDRLPEAYERVLVDAIRSDHSLFASNDEVLASWKILEPIFEHWNFDTKDLRLYKPGSTIDEVINQAV
ncbi:MAG: glucose-6-phosphate dehydrogenase [Candidatus Saccharimonadales bacterium]